MEYKNVTTNIEKIITKNGNGIVDVSTILSQETKNKISTLGISEKKIANARKDFANLKFFIYWETKIANEPVIILGYDNKKYKIPWECNSNLEVFYLVVNELAVLLGTSASNSNLPKKEI